jgi:hypothetical protein
MSPLAGLRRAGLTMTPLPQSGSAGITKQPADFPSEQVLFHGSVQTSID